MLLRLLDLLTFVLICLALVFGPWAFATAQPWSLNVMNVVGGVLGLLWLAGAVGGRLGPDKPLSWAPTASKTVRALGVMTILVLLYCLISAVNARATYAPKSWQFLYHPAILWLPHSYDADLSWAMFWRALGLAGLFWSVRGWLLTVGTADSWELSQGEDLSAAGHAGSDSRFPASGIRLPTRVRRLLWVLAVSATLLAIEGFAQRIAGVNKLLWLVQLQASSASQGGNAYACFGAFPYRASAALYFNMLWPVILGFCWIEFAISDQRRPESEASARKGAWLLLVAVIVMAICPLVAGSRAGAAITALNLVLASTVFWFAIQKKDSRLKFIVPAAAAVILLIGLFLGAAYLLPRFKTLSVDAQFRNALTQVGDDMAADNPVFGTGPGTLETMYQMYMHNWNDFWPAQLHNDWQELLATFGWVGFLMIMTCLALAVAHWFFGRGIPAEKLFVRLLWIALAGCLIHARFDWPFECHPDSVLFLVLCAILSCLSRTPART